MKLGEAIQRIQYLEQKEELIQMVVQSVTNRQGSVDYPADMIAEVQADIDRLLRAPVLEELEELKGKEVRDGRRRTAKSEG
jgi:hypothetical protein